MARAISPIEVADMGAGGDFRHHAAIGRVVLRLGQHEVRQDMPPAIGLAPHHGGGGLVARGFDAEDQACHGRGDVSGESG